MEAIQTSLRDHGIHAHLYHANYPLKQDQKDYREHGWNWTDDEKAARGGYMLELRHYVAESGAPKDIVARMVIVSRPSKWPNVDVEIWHYIEGSEVTEVDINENGMEQILDLYREYKSLHEA